MALHTPTRAHATSRPSAVLAPLLSVLIAAGCGGNVTTEGRSQDPLAQTAGDADEERVAGPGASADDSQDPEQRASGSDSPSAHADDAANSANLNPVSEDPSALQAPTGSPPDSEQDGSGDVETPVAAQTEGETIAVTGPSQACPSPPATEASEVARRLERLLWNSEEGELVDLLDMGELSLDTPAEIMDQASAMLEDDRARAGLNQFVRAWLDLSSEYLDFEKPLLGSVTQSTQRTIDALVWGTDGRTPGGVSTLFASNQAMVDAELAAFYEIDAPSSEWELVELPEAHSLGLVSQALWLNTNPNPSWRGFAIRQSMTCVAVPPPPAGIAPIRDLAEGTTTREAYSQHATDPVCAACHRLIDPVGFGFEHFDSSGAYRDQDNGFPIDATGEFTDLELSFDGTAGLRDLLTGELSQTVETCLVQNAVQYAATDVGGNRTYAVPKLESGCFHVNNKIPAAGLDASLQEWLLSIVASDEFVADYE
jgi:hypothetical protein